MLTRFGRRRPGKPPAIVLALLALAFSAVASATLPAQTSDAEKFRAEVESLNRKPLPDGEPLGQVVANALLVDARHRGLCQPKSADVGPLRPVTLDPLVTSLIQQGKVENAWIVSVQGRDCPSADPIRILVIRAIDGRSLQASFAGPGDSIAWPTLAREGLRVTLAKTVEKLRSADPACTPPNILPVSVRIGETSLDLGPDIYGIRLKGWWEEVWTFEPCGHKVAVPIRFTADGRGGAYWDVDPATVVYTP